jgi:hypothetical protein
VKGFEWDHTTEKQVELRTADCNVATAVRDRKAGEVHMPPVDTFG